MESKNIIECEVIDENKQQLVIPNDVNKKDIRNYSYSNENGKEVTKINLHSNISLKQETYRSGVVVQNKISIPTYDTISERNNIIVDMYNNKHTQDEIAKTIGLKQPSISRVIAKNKKKNNL